jgi:oligoendopeptidase F
MSTSFPQVRWDLSAFFSSIEDPKVESTWEEANKLADAFEQTYRDALTDPNLDGATLLKSIQDCEALYDLVYRPISYANLMFSCDSSTPEVAAFMADQQERVSEISVKMIFFNLALQEMDDAVVARALASTPALEEYRHFLEVTRKYRPHKLSESEEIILEETANVGTRAWVRLHDELLANQLFPVTFPDGITKELTQPEVLDLLRHPDRATRQAGADGLSAGLQPLKRTLTFGFNTLLLDKKIEDRLRKHPYAEHTRHLSNELEKATVDLVVGMCHENYGLVERFYRVKREILGLDELTHIDRYAPLMETQEIVEFEKGREIVLGSLGAFSPIMREKAGEFFTENWIDAEPRPGKQGGAFCSSSTPEIHPVVFMNYQNKMDDVGTLAHELGHGIHASLSRRQKLMNYHSTLCLAELASTFCEMLVFEKLMESASQDEKLAMVAGKIEDTFATVFRQAAMFRFEQRAHNARREEGEQSSEELGQIWQEELQAMFGDSVKLGEQHRDWWLYIPHFVGSPFYVYAYSFGELLVLSLFEKAKAEGAAFAENYVELLARGGSQSPHESMALVGADLDSREFWQGGFDFLTRLMEQFEGLWAAKKVAV